MDFGLTEEQQMIVDTTRSFVENELYPHELQRSNAPAICAWS
jgi:acyl-CoA dehydrogenase